jgi:formylglycine-generating enzyme required for sulfatase activity
MGVTDRIPLRLPLLELYVPLTARQRAPEGEAVARGLRLAGRKPTEAEVAEMGERLGQPVPILELLGKHDGLVVLGDPGAGKSTFLKYLAVSLASGGGAELGLGERVPLLLSLGGYADALTHGDVPLDDYFARHYRERGIDLDLASVLDEALDRGRALVLLDGLDEVKDLATRHTVAARVLDFYTVHRAAGNKFVLTSRIVGYREVALVAEGLSECTLLDFEDAEIEAFVDRWTRALEKAAYGAGAAAEYEAQAQKDGLLRALRNNPGVRELAANPLLLTILAVMKRQGIELPERRVELYEACVKALLEDWQRARSLSGRALPHQDRQTTLKVLAPVALWMQREAPGAGLVREGDLRRFLETLFAGRQAADPEAEAEAFLAVARVSNLLVDRGGRQFGFLHLTFQEYLAAVALTQSAQKSLEPLIAEISAHVGDPAWREVSRLAVAHLGVVKQNDEQAELVIDHLLEHQPGEPGEAEILAGFALLDLGSGGVPKPCRERGVAALLRTLTDSPRVPPVRRAEAGRVLSDLGDPRESATTLDGMEFCWVPPGPFWMGSVQDDPERFDDESTQYELDLPEGYWLARFPVTGAQWRAYVSESGAEVGDRDSLEIAANEPVFWVSWAEAEVFCRWLTERWHRAGLLPAGWAARLPSEEEWEKAARGGLQVPVEVQVDRPGALPLLEPRLKLKPNPEEGRAYPWQGPADSERANYDETHIGRPSAVGAFPAGQSPCGCEELSGNVWEWTRSLAKPGDDTLRVLRGGAFFFGARNVRCSYRFWSLPNFRGGLFGFRVLLSPFFSEP